MTENKRADVCLVELRSYSEDREKPNSGVTDSSCSGLRISDSHVITVASVLLPLLTHNRVPKNGSILSRESTAKSRLKCLLKRDFYANTEFSGIECSLKFENELSLTSNRNTETRELQTHGLDAQETACQKQLEDKTVSYKAVPGTIECVWRAVGFSNVLRKTFPSYAAWKLNYEADSQENRESGTDKNVNKTRSDSKDETLFDPDDLDKILSYFVLIRLEDTNSTCEGHSRDICHPLNVDIGVQVSVQGTPFGSLSPSVFLNSVSTGVLCNKAGPEAEVLLTDARCLPGCEGGALYFGPQHDERLLGIIVSPMCWKSTEWVGLTIACSLAEVIRSLRRCLTSQSKDVNEERSLIERIQELDTSTDHAPSIASVKHLSDIYKNVVLIQTNGSWGSGVVIDRRRGLIVTCSHVVKKAQSVRVRFDHPAPHWLRADVVYSGPDPPVAYDIALLECRQWSEEEETHGTIIQQPKIAVAERGTRAYVIGHALLGKEHRLPPSITRGVIATVVKHERVPVLLQSTCAVHSGASGGPLVDVRGALLGIVVCNAKDTASGSSFPHVNLSVPMATIWPCIQEYIQTRDKSYLENLHVTNKPVQHYWQLKREKPIAMESKL